MHPMTYQGTRTYAGRVTATLPTDSGQASVRMTSAAIDALHELARPQAAAVARAIAAVGQTAGKPVDAPLENGRQYYAMVPDDDKAPVVMYREADDGGYLVTALVDRDTYQTYEIAEQPGFLQSNSFKAAVGAVAAAALGIILGARSNGKRS